MERSSAKSASNMTMFYGSERIWILRGTRECRTKIASCGWESNPCRCVARPSCDCMFTQGSCCRWDVQSRCSFYWLHVAVDSYVSSTGWMPHHMFHLLNVLRRLALLTTSPSVEVHQRDRARSLMCTLKWKFIFCQPAHKGFAFLPVQLIIEHDCASTTNSTCRGFLGGIPVCIEANLPWLPEIIFLLHREFQGFSTDEIYEWSRIHFASINIV